MRIRALINGVCLLLGAVLQLRTEDLDVLYGAPTAPSTIDGQPPAVGVSSSAAPTAPLLTEIIRMANDKIQVTYPLYRCPPFPPSALPPFRPFTSMRAAPSVMVLTLQGALLPFVSRSPQS